MNSATLKERHYVQLAAKLQDMSQHLADTQQHFADVTRQLEHMKKLGALHASQFMAVSRLLDMEEDAEEQQAQAQASGSGSGSASRT